MPVTSNDWVTSGKIATQARVYAISLCKKGAKHLEIADKIEARIIHLGGKPAFPMDVSVNAMAAHDCPFPNDQRTLQKGDLVKLDMGVHVNGCVTDTAVTVEVGTNKHADLIKASEDALVRAEKLAIETGTRIADIGQVISDTIKRYGFTPIANLSGHGVGLYIVHDKPTIPNYNNGDANKLPEGLKIAIEPFATTGQGLVSDGKPAGIYRLLQKKPTRILSARKLIEFIQKEYNTLPFCTRWLLPHFSNAQLLLRLLEKEEIIKQYTQLPEKSGGMVSQAEHTIEVGYGVLTK